jgi:stage V sporulation protein K
MFQMQCDDRGYLVSEETLTVFSDVVGIFADRIGTLGNGRFARNIFDRCIANQCNRLASIGDATPTDYQTFLPIDIPSQQKLIEHLDID